MLTESKNIDIGTSVNTIYFTNRCNLACTYCYEVLDVRLISKQLATLF